MEIKTEDIDFRFLYKVVRIDIDKVTFRKFEIKRNSSLVAEPGYEIVEISDKEIGEETYVCKPEVIEKLAGGAGTILLKEFKTKVIGRKRKKLIVDDVNVLVI